MKQIVRSSARNGYLFALALFLVAPLIVVAGISVNSSAQMTFPPSGISLKWYAGFFSDPQWIAALTRSVVIAIGASALATSIALPVAYVQWKTGSRLANVIGVLAGIPFVLPPVILAVLYLLFWGTMNHVGRIENVVISHAVTFAAIPLVMISLGFSSIDQSLVEAARTMGAREGDILRTVALPIIMPFIASSCIFVAIFSLNEYIIAFMVAGLTAQTMPVKIFMNMRTGFSPIMCVAAILFVAIGLLGFAGVARMSSITKLLGARE